MFAILTHGICLCRPVAMSMIEFITSFQTHRPGGSMSSHQKLNMSSSMLVPCRFTFYKNTISTEVNDQLIRTISDRTLDVAGCNCDITFCRYAVWR
jgi:hypothetical protein